MQFKKGVKVTDALGNDVGEVDRVVIDPRAGQGGPQEVGEAGTQRVDLPRRLHLAPRVLAPPGRARASGCPR